MEEKGKVIYGYKIFNDRGVVRKEEIWIFKDGCYGRIMPLR